MNDESTPGISIWVRGVRSRLIDEKERGLGELDRFIQDQGFDFLRNYVDSVMAGPSGNQE